MCRLLQGYGYPVQPGEAVSYGSTPDLTGLDGVHIECKRGEKQALYEWIEQAQRDSGKFKDGLPAIFWRKNRAPWLVCMTLADWIRILEARKKRQQRQELQSEPCGLILKTRNFASDTAKHSPE